MATLALNIMFKHEYEHRKRTQTIRITTSENMRQNVGFRTTFEANLNKWIIQLTWIGPTTPRNTPLRNVDQNWSAPSEGLSESGKSSCQIPKQISRGYSKWR